MSTRATMIDPERQMLGEVEMVGQDRWEEIHRRAGAGASIRRLLASWTWTARRCGDACGKRSGSRTSGLRRADTLLATHAAYLRRRAADVGYSAQVLFQELRGRQYEGSYETVKRFVRPLRGDAVVRGGDAYAVRKHRQGCRARLIGVKRGSGWVRSARSGTSSY